MIVVEGPDGAGKTWMVNLLHEEFGYPIAPRVVSKDTEAMVDLQDWVDRNLDEGFQATIFDRYRLISETIYGPLLRGKAQPGFDNIRWLAPRLQRFYDIKPFIIYCMPPLAAVEANLDGDLDNVAVVHKTRAIYSAYTARVSLDLLRSRDPEALGKQGTPIAVWDYINSPTIKKKPVWLKEVKAYVESRTA